MGELTLERVNLRADREHNLGSHFRFRAPPPVGHVNRIAVAKRAAPVPAQHFDHLKAIRAEPFALVLVLHFSCPPFSPACLSGVGVLPTLV
jgi:hypothetical protein